MAGVTYARFFPGDWRTGSSYSLNLEEEGLYIRCCAYMWDTGRPIPGDNATAARELHVQIQKYMKVMDALLDKGKMIRAQGVIINERVQEELDRYRGEAELRSDRAKVGHQHRKMTKDKLDELSAQLAAMQAERDALLVKVETAPPHQPPGQPPHQPPLGNQGGTPPLPPTGESEKPNKNNEPQLQVQSACSANPEARSQKLSITSGSNEPDGNRIGNNFSPQAPKGAASKLDKQWQNATSRADKLRGRDPMDGSKGVKLEDGMLSVVNGTKLKLCEQFPGVDIDGVCVKALPTFLTKAKREGGPTPEMALAVIRQYAQYDKEALAKAPPRKAKQDVDEYADLPPSIRQTLKTIPVESRARIAAEYREKRNA